MDKLIHDEEKDTTPTTISNDGATIMKLLNIVHPAANCGVLDWRVFCGMQNCM
jgi:chaperonin GroEL (HSP60 family)